MLSRHVVRSLHFYTALGQDTAYIVFSDVTVVAILEYKLAETLHECVEQETATSNCASAPSRCPGLAVKQKKAGRAQKNAGTEWLVPLSIVIKSRGSSDIELLSAKKLPVTSREKYV